MAYSLVLCCILIKRENEVDNMSSSFKGPADVAKAVASTGGVKGSANLVNLILLSFLAGAYIAFGGLLAEVANAGISVFARYRKRGPEKNHRKDPIIHMGLLMDANGIRAEIGRASCRERV